MQIAATSEAIFAMPVFNWAKAYFLRALTNMANPSLSMDYVNFFKMAKADTWTKKLTLDTPMDLSLDEATIKAQLQAEKAEKENLIPETTTGLQYAVGLTGQGLLRLISFVPMVVAFVAHELVNAVVVVISAAVALLGLPFDLVIGSGKGVAAGFKAAGKWWYTEDDAYIPPSSPFLKKAAAHTSAQPGVEDCMLEESEEERLEKQRIAQLVVEYKQLVAACDEQGRSGPAAEALDNFQKEHRIDIVSIIEGARSTRLTGPR